LDGKSSFTLLCEEIQARCSASAIITGTTTGQQAETDEYREVLAAVINGVLTWAR
jgi:predicted TIM-barrel enzyme